MSTYSTTTTIEPGAIVAIWGVAAVIFGLISGAIWSSKGGSWMSGFLLGALLGLIGLIAVAAMRVNPSPEVLAAQAEQYRECPWCKEGMRRDASVCARCQRPSEPWVFHDGRWWSGFHWLDQATGQWVPFTPAPTASTMPPPP